MSSLNLVYLHRNKINNKIYIGRTCHINNPNIRWQNGFGYSGQPFFEDIIKYGWNNFEHIILETNLSNEEVNRAENFWIKYYKSDQPEYGYNLQSSGSVNEVTREHMSQAWESNPARREAQKQLMINLNKNIDRTGTNNPMYGTKRSGANAGRKCQVQCIETGEIFETLTDASKWCNPSGSNLKTHIRQQILGQRKSCGKHPETGEPLHWRYYNNKEKE